MYHQINGFKNGANEADRKIDQEAIANNPDGYKAKIKWLKSRWPEHNDSTAARLITPILYSIAPSLHHAIVADNLEYFSKHYDKTQINSNAALAIACLSGSQNIATFLLNQLNLKYTSDGNQYILNYVCSSNNVEWAESIANSFREAGKIMPADIDAYADDDTMDKIIKVFEQRKPTSSAPKATY